jgi:hypothetical protein
MPLLKRSRDWPLQGCDGRGIVWQLEERKSGLRGEKHPYPLMKQQFGVKYTLTAIRKPFVCTGWGHALYLRFLSKAQT